MIYSESELTPWFDGRTKPARPGVYMLKCGGTAGTDGFQHWDGKTWGPWSMSAEHAADRKPHQCADLLYQDDDWRGLRKRPNAELSGPQRHARKDEK